MQCTSKFSRISHVDVDDAVIIDDILAPSGTWKTTISLELSVDFFVLSTAMENSYFGLADEHDADDFSVGFKKLAKPFMLGKVTAVVLKSSV
jgi:hypothetical protein